MYATPRMTAGDIVITVASVSAVLIVGSIVCILAIIFDLIYTP